jgi:CDP-diacylglycerol--glycerol-3-phosphate 3-phosphatidyltransferase
MQMGANLTQEHPRWLKRLPNQLTALRILCIPLVVWLMIQGAHYEDGMPFQVTVYDAWASVIFSLAAITDFFDGWLARRFNVETLFGKLLDPLADKLLVVSALIILVDKHRMEGWIAVILIVRDLGINAIRIAALEENIDVPSSWLGKTKTFLIDFAIGFLAVNGTIGGFLPCREIGQAFLWAALFASVVSAVQYLVGYARQSKGLSMGA